MLRKEICYLKLTLVIIQIVVLFLFYSQIPWINYIFSQVTYNSLAVIFIFALNGYAYYECLKNRFVKGGHLLTFIALTFQTSFILYLTAVIWLLIETYVLWKNHVPRPIEKVFKMKNNF